MPSINRIRVNNVKYNFGTQAYDDFTMRLYGQNTLYDLANGGGKSVLMLLLMQCMIPNCTLDEKQPLEKLFRDSCGNGTIHSLIEWKLDPENVTDGFRYLTTGFAARKARDRGEETEKDIASVEYFNYCIFYQEYGKHDIVNLPLSDGEDRMTYQALKNYLHDLARRENRLQVFIFDRKGEYQRFISRYGIIPSQWEIIRGINKTEGHVRTYFETNYRTTRKVVEDLLIEEIIEKAYLTKTEQENQQDASARLLMSIREQLRTLAEKKKDIHVFDHEAELIRLLSDRIQSFTGLYLEREKAKQAIGSIYLTLDRKNTEYKGELDRLQEVVDRAEQESDAAGSYLEGLKTAGLEREYEEKEQGLRLREAELSRDMDRARVEHRDISYRRAVADFLTLKDEEGKLRELQAEEKSEMPEEIAPVIAGIREYYRQEEEDLQARIKEARKRLGDLAVKKDMDDKALADARVELAVLSHEEAGLKLDRKGISDRRDRLTAQLSEVNLKPLEIRIEEGRQEKARLEEESFRMQEELAILDEEGLEAEQVLRDRKHDLFAAEEAEKQYEETRAQREAGEKRLQEIARIYHAAVDEEDPSEAVYRKLSRDMVRLSQLDTELAGLEKRRGEVREGRLIPRPDAVEAVLSYISTRHGGSAMFGMDYLAQLTAAEKERCLGNIPELPYGIVARDFEQLIRDTGLGQVETGGCVVRIYDWDMLGDIAEASEQGYAVRHTGAFFLGEDTQEKLQRDMEDRIRNLTTEKEYLKDAVRTEREDMEFALKFRSLDTPAPVQGSADELRAEVEALLAGHNAWSQGRRELSDRIAEDEDRIRVLGRDIEILEGLQRIDGQERETLRQLSELRRTRERYEQGIREKEGNAGLRKQEEAGLISSISGLEEALTVSRVSWQEKYAPYVEGGAMEEKPSGVPVHTGGEVSPAEGSIEELEASFRLWKQGREAAEEVLRQRERLRSAIEGGIARLKQSISDRNVEVEELEEAYAGGRILPVDTEALREREKEADRIDRQLEDRKDKLSQEREEISRLAGSIEYAIANYKAVYGEYEGFTQDMAELKRLIPLAEQRKAEAKEALVKARTGLKDYQKQGKEWEGLYREAARLVERNRIDTSETGLCPEDTDLTAAFEEQLMALDRTEKALDRARSQMLRTKGQVTQTLMELGASTLAISIRDDAELPRDRAEAEDLVKRLSDMRDLIGMERARVEEGISDMERLKENFVDQCLERCLDVRTELDKLPRLSQIEMDGGQLQMVKLSVPYVKDEFLRQRMADYIDHIVSEADTRKTEEDQHRYLTQELALKRLFSVIVTDMNKIRLSLYKRERIREQSRYLRYEEAVGSTGQSQGIYIQFLVSVINYISGMYAMQDSGQRSKVIFIDNPFGAAKDIYIWEPIFALLKANHVQLIVPSRGATPEITGRFDVNYILGQQMTEGRAITVVVRYSSRSDEENTEYKELSYEQATFDFI